MAVVMGRSPATSPRVTFRPTIVMLISAGVRRRTVIFMRGPGAPVVSRNFQLLPDELRNQPRDPFPPYRPVGRVTAKTGWLAASSTVIDAPVTTGSNGTFVGG